MDYSTERKKFWRTQIKRHIVEGFGGKCQCCNQIFDDCCFDLHHLNPVEKDFTISSIQFTGAKTWLKIRDEVKKCALVCSNCHRLIHNNLIEAPLDSNFNNDYYEWEPTNFTQVDYNLNSLDANYICPNCGGRKSAQANLCINCANVRHYEVTREELKKLIYTKSFVSIGKQFGVSDNAIRKRCKSFGLPSTKEEIKKYTPEEWDKI